MRFSLPVKRFGDSGLPRNPSINFFTSLIRTSFPKLDFLCRIGRRNYKVRIRGTTSTPGRRCRVSRHQSHVISFQSPSLQRPALQSLYRSKKIGVLRKCGLIFRIESKFNPDCKAGHKENGEELKTNKNKQSSSKGRC